MATTAPDLPAINDSAIDCTPSSIASTRSLRFDLIIDTGKLQPAFFDNRESLKIEVPLYFHRRETVIELAFVDPLFYKFGFEVKNLRQAVDIFRFEFGRCEGERV